MGISDGRKHGVRSIQSDRDVALIDIDLDIDLAIPNARVLPTAPSCAHLLIVSSLAPDREEPQGLFAERVNRASPPCTRIDAHRTGISSTGCT